MHLTEEQASHRCCPFAVNEEGHFGPCAASGCMAWKEGKSAWRYSDGKILETYKEPADYSTRGGGWVERGYCGLTNEPPK